MAEKNGERKKIELSYWRNQQPPQSVQGQTYKDPIFPPNANSLLGLDSNGNPVDSKAYTEKAKSINTNDITFARPNEIFGDKYKLFSEKIEMDDVIQGKLGDCYFLSSVANLCKFPSLIMKLFKTKDTNPDGFYEIVLFIDGKPQIVIVDDYLPVDRRTKKPVYAQSKGKEIWVMLLEKAWAKVNGGYANIISGLPCEALEFLTGLGSLTFDTENLSNEDDLNEYKYEIIKNVQIADKNNCLITCSTSSNPNIEKVGLVDGHAYTLVSFHQITTSQGKTVYLFRIRNPWSQGEWSGDWSDKSKLWDDKSKSQVNFQNKEDGIFFMNDTDFFKYFTHVEIGYILYDSISVTYTIEGDKNLKDASVFNIETEGDGFLSVTVIRKSWRANRELRDKILPTHISVVKYDPKPKNRLKTFSDYNGTFESYQTCAINVKVVKGNYLVYVFRDLDHAEFTPDKNMEIKITCSAKFKHAQMSYDDRDKGFPLLQNIILQAEFKENNYDPDLGEDFDVNANQIRGNGIGHIIYYISTPGYYLDFTGGTANVRNYIMLCPYLNKQTTTFHRAVPSGKYLVLLGLMNGVYGSYSFNCFTRAYTTNRKIAVEFDNNDIDLTLYTDINNDIKNEKVKERKTQSLEMAQKTFYFDIGDGTVQYKTLDQLKSLYPNEIKLLDEVELSNSNNSNLRWGIIKGEYVTYVGQFNGDKKEGKGLFITPNNIFAGEFKNDQQNGKGFTYNKDYTKLYYCNYVNGARKGKPITPEQEQEELDQKKKEEEERQAEELRKEQEKLKKLQEEKDALIKKQEEEKILLEKKMQEEIRKAEEAKKREEERIAAELKKAQEEAKRLEEERQKKQEELERLALEEKKRLEEAAKQAAELKRQEEERIKKEKEEADRLRKLEEERIKAELEELKKKEEEEAKKKMEELKKKEEELRLEALRKEEEAKKKLEEAQKEAERKAEELKKEAEKKAEEEKKKALEAKEAAEREIQKAKEAAAKKEEEAKRLAEEAKKKEEEAKRKAEEAKKEAEKKANEISQQVQKSKEEAKKLEDNYNNFVEQRRREMEERRKLAEERMRQQQEMMQQQQAQQQMQYGVNFVYPDYTQNKKRRQNNVLPFEGDIMDACVTCGCEIF